MDLFVLPTYREGLPGVLFEAAVMQVPVVAISGRAVWISFRVA